MQFTFILNKADQMPTAEREKQVGMMCGLLGIRATFLDRVHLNGDSLRFRPRNTQTHFGGNLASPQMFWHRVSPAGFIRNTER